MAFILARLFVRTPTRIRFFFTDTVTAAPLSSWQFSSLDGNPDPVQVESLIVQGSQVEVVLSAALVGGGSYRATLRALHVASGFPTAPAATFDFRAPASAAAPSQQLSIAAFKANLFGEDVVWTGSDWAEGADGDLLVNTGPDVAVSAVLRRESSEGLMWDPSYGLKPSDFVDAPAGELANLVRRIERQAIADDRVKAAKAKALGAAADDPEQQIVGLDVTLIDGTSRSLSVPVQAG